jgi:hypothetical protein
MPTPTIPAGNLFMNATTYASTGATLTITNGVAGQSFQPDFGWFKHRQDASRNHALVDSVRGTGEYLFCNLTSTAETGITDAVTSFNSNGFTLGANTGGTNVQYTVNEGGGTPNEVVWSWKAGGTAVSNTAGTISSQVSANTTSGFSIVTYTGTGANATVGHGLGVAPKMIIVKRRDAVAYWDVYHASIGATGRLYLNTTDATNTSSAPWNDTAPTSSVFTVGTATDTNASGSTIVAYCWAPIAGYSAFGSYTGNGSTDGTFVYLGFRPRFVMVKCSSDVTSWWVYDSSRSTYNAVDLGLIPNATNADTSGYPLDFLSNGIKFRNSNGDFNGSGRTYIYMAFAENPFKYALAR